MYLFEMAVEGRLVVVVRPYEYPAVRVLWHRLISPDAGLDIPRAADVPGNGGDAQVALRRGRAVGWHKVEGHRAPVHTETVTESDEYGGYKRRGYHWTSSAVADQRRLLHWGSGGSYC